MQDENGLASRLSFREVKLRAEAKVVRFRSAEHLVRAVVGGAPSMMGALTRQGEGLLDAGMSAAGGATLSRRLICVHARLRDGTV